MLFVSITFFNVVFGWKSWFVSRVECRESFFWLFLGTLNGREVGEFALRHGVCLFRDRFPLNTDCDTRPHFNQYTIARLTGIQSISRALLQNVLSLFG